MGCGNNAACRKLGPLNKIILVFVAVVLWVLNFGSAAFSQEKSGITYTVQPGDSLLSIAENLYGESRHFHTILAATKKKSKSDISFYALPNADHIRVGDKLWLPDIAIYRGTVQVQGVVFNNHAACNRDVEVSVTLTPVVYLGASPRFEADVHRAFGPTCFSFEHDFKLSGVLTKLPENQYVYNFKTDTDALTINFKPVLGSHAMEFTFRNDHHFCCGDDGQSNVGSQLGAGELKKVVE